MKKFNVALATLFMAATSFGFSAMATSELDRPMANTTKAPKGLPEMVILKKDKEGNFEVAIDKNGACANKVCDVEKLALLKYKKIIPNTPYTGELKELAANELNQDAGANRESWFWWGGGWGMGWGSIWGWGGGWATAYRPYWGGYYPYAYYGNCYYGAYSWYW